MADYDVIDNVAVITCQNPPVNQLGERLRVGLFDGMKKGLANPNVDVIVIIGGGRTFPAGADITEFSSGKAFESIPKFFSMFDDSPKPIVAAIHGTALGGGLELALTCHYRLGTSNCRVGLPEVLLGILPAGGGTQRLPRVVGSMIAAEMICTGQHIRAQRAHRLGILDIIIEIDNKQVKGDISLEQSILRSESIKFAKKIANKPFADRIIAKKKVEPLDDFFYDQLREQLKKRGLEGHIAPELCIQAVKAAAESKSFEDGIKRERELLMKLASGNQSKALQYSFFAQRAINKIPGIGANLKNMAKKINKVGIIGCGTMGGGILMNFIQKGIPVVVLETKQAFLDRGLGVVKGNWMRQVKKGKLTQAKFEKYVGMIQPTLSYDDLRDVDIVIEAVFENLAIKEKVFRKLDSVCKSDCILASNTSFLDIATIASYTRNPSRVIGTHFFAPANQMTLLENVRHDKNDNVTIATVQQMAKTIGKKGVLVGTCDGFVGNRMFSVEHSEAFRLLLEGAMPHEIDSFLRKDFGFKMGIFQVLDLSGLDVLYRSRKDRGWLENNYLNSPYGKEKGYYPFELGDILVSEKDRLGLKAGKGMYDYNNMKTRKPERSSMVEKLLIELSKKNGIERRNISKDELTERLFYPMINEGFKILEEKIAIRPSDIDVISVFGYGFPIYKGGPMFWADLVGLRKIRDALVKYNRLYPNIWYFKVKLILQLIFVLMIIMVLL